MLWPDKSSQTGTGQKYMDVPKKTYIHIKVFLKTPTLMPVYHCHKPVFRPKMATSWRAGMKEGGLPLPIAFRFSINLPKYPMKVSKTQLSEDTLALSLIFYSPNKLYFSLFYVAISGNTLYISTMRGRYFFAEFWMMRAFRPRDDYGYVCLWRYFSLAAMKLDQNHTWLCFFLLKMTSECLIFWFCEFSPYLGLFL